MGKVDILSIAREAQAKKLINPKVIDATIGMFYNDDRQLVIPEVREAFYKLDILETFKYGATDGGKIFEENVINWVLNDKRDLLETKFKLTGLSTPGGSGALSIIFNAYGKSNDKVLVSDIRWRYDYFIRSAKMDVHEHKMFDGEGFNLNDFENQLTYLTESQKRVIVVINDPCHNPTGYQLSKDEWISIINILNKYDKNEIILTYDIAYFDYDPNGFNKARNTFELFMRLKKHVNVLVAFSASKSFAIYGVRLGGLISLNHNDEQYKFFKKDAIDDALGKWSTAPSVGVGIFNQIVDQKLDYINTLNTLTSTLKSRGNIFMKEVSENGLETYPYRGGFFVLIKTDNPIEDYLKLVKDDIYVVPMQYGLRVALCGITTTEVKGLAKRIKDIIK